MTILLKTSSANFVAFNYNLSFTVGVHSIDFVRMSIGITDNVKSVLCINKEMHNIFPDKSKTDMYQLTASLYLGVVDLRWSSKSKSTSTRTPGTCESRLRIVLPVSGMTIRR